jgi:putative phosphoesterase
MRIALISDIHANLPALEAVLTHAKSLGIKRYWCLGDLVQFNAFPEEVVKKIRKMEAVCIHGNIDLKVLEMKQELKQAPYEELPEEISPFAWSYLQLSKQSKKFLKKLPEKAKIKIRGFKFLLIHGSPIANDDPIYIDTPKERLEELVEGVKADIILCGHTHKPFIHEVNDIHIINPGSVGRPIDHDPRASYAVLTLKKKYVGVEFYRVEFDLQLAVDSIREAGLPETYARLVESGISLDDLKNHDSEEPKGEK